MTLRVIFAGTDAIAIPVLSKLLNSDHEVVAVYTKADKPSGRGQHLVEGPIKGYAKSLGLPIYQPVSLKDSDAQQVIKDLNADVMVVFAYGLLLPVEILNSFEYGCVNVHPSLLPRWRGAAPIQRAIFAGDEKTGVTIMQLDEGWDTGDILAQQEIVIGQAETAASLGEKVENVAADLLIEVLNKIELHELHPIPQDDAESCYADKITKDEAKINWQLSSREIDCSIRAFNPKPVAFTLIDENILRIWSAELLCEEDDSKLEPGTILAFSKKGIDVVTGRGILRLLEMQLPGGKILTPEAMLNSKKDLFRVGKKFNA